MRWGLAVRRGRRLSVPPPPAVATPAGVWVPALIQARRRGYSLRRSRIQLVPPTTPGVVPPASISTRRRPAAVRRGRVWALPPTAVAISNTGPVPLALVRRARSTLAVFSRLAAFLATVPAVPIVVAAVPVPAPISRTLFRVGTSRRGRVLAVPLTSTPAPTFAVPVFRGRRCVRGASHRAGRVLAVPMRTAPISAAPPPGRARCVRPAYRTVRRGRRFEPMLVGNAAPPVPDAVIPNVTANGVVAPLLVSGPVTTGPFVVEGQAGSGSFVVE